MNRLGLCLIGWAGAVGSACGESPSSDVNPFTGGGTGLTSLSNGDPTEGGDAASSGGMADTDGATSGPPATSGSGDGGSDDAGPVDSSDDAPPPGTCGNNVLEAGEVCDLSQLDGQTCASLGHDGGTLACLLDCSDFNLAGCYICGNGVLDQGEDCEGEVPENVDCESFGLGGGTVVCGDDCFYDTSDCSVCGDGVVQGTEACDDTDLGGQTCASLGLSGGDLGCSAGCTYDFLGCDIAGMPFGDDGHYSGFVLQPAVLPCDDISATGTLAALSDDSNQVVPMGFSFPVYGTDYTDVNIQSNGTLRWGDNQYLSFGNTCLPTASTPNTNTLYVFWDDLNPGAAGGVRYETLGAAGSQRFVVQWDVPNFGGDTTDLMRFQVVLHEATGQIEVCYVDTLNAANTANNGAEATSGIGLDGVTALQYSCDTPDLTNGTMLLYIPS